MLKCGFANPRVAVSAPRDVWGGTVPDGKWGKDGLCGIPFPLDRVFVNTTKQ